MARNSSNKCQDGLMLDSGTTAHMMPEVQRLENTKMRSINISLGDNYVIEGSHSGHFTVMWGNEHEKTEVQLSGVLASKYLAMNLLSTAIDIDPCTCRKG